MAGEQNDMSTIKQWWETEDGCPFPTNDEYYCKRIIEEMGEQRGRRRIAINAYLRRRWFELDMNKDFYRRIRKRTICVIKLDS